MLETYHLLAENGTWKLGSCLCTGILLIPREWPLSNGGYPAQWTCLNKTRYFEETVIPVHNEIGNDIVNMNEANASYIFVHRVQLPAMKYFQDEQKDVVAEANSERNELKVDENDREKPYSCKYSQGKRTRTLGTLYCKTRCKIDWPNLE